MKLFENRGTEFGAIVSAGADWRSYNNFVQTIKTNYSAYDQNGDGSLSQLELTAAVGNERLDPAARQAAKTLSSRFQEAQAMADVNADTPSGTVTDSKYNELFGSDRAGQFSRRDLAVLELLINPDAFSQAIAGHRTSELTWGVARSLWGGAQALAGGALMWTGIMSSPLAVGVPVTVGGAYIATDGANNLWHGGENILSPGTQILIDQYRHRQNILKSWIPQPR